MRLLLTSAGLVNKTILDSLVDLVGEDLQGMRLAFIPTAANVEAGDKHWLIDDYNNCRKVGFEVDIVDISALTKQQWLPRLQEARVLFFGGGNTFHLMYWLKKSGLQALLPGLLKNRVYIGLSAGSCVTGPTVFNSVQNLFDESYEIDIRDGLALVKFQFVPHFNSPYFPSIRKANLKQAVLGVKEPVYVLDDNSALVIKDDKLKVVSEGEWYRFE